MSGAAPEHGYVMAPTLLLNTTVVAIVDYALYVFFLSVSMTLLGSAVWPAIKGWLGGGKSY